MPAKKRTPERLRTAEMIILGIESASLTASAAIVTDGILTAEYTVNHKKTHSQTLLPMLDEICRMAELDKTKIDAIAVSSGPGSFTGLRIGAATAKGLGLALELPIVPVPTLEGLAYNLFGADALICPVMDARRGQVYNGLYRCRETLETVEDGRAVSAAELVRELNGRGERVIFLGDGIPVIRSVAEDLTVPYSFAPANSNRQRAASVAALGAVYFAEGKAVPSADFAPDYLRKSQAEREREAAEAAGADAEQALAAGCFKMRGEENG